MATDEGTTQRVETIVVGAGQAGLSVGYHLARRGRRFLILDANDRIGDVWRQRWDSLRLFTPARYDGLDGMPFPAPPRSFPTKDAMADYLEAYAARFDLPVRTGTRVDRLTRAGDRYEVTAGDDRYEADNVVVALGTFQKPRIPAFAGDLDPAIVQLHSSAYRNPGQLADGDVLLVGAGNSGSEIAMELSRAGHHVTMAGRDTGHLPFRVDSWLGFHLAVPFVLRFLFTRVLSVDTPIGRRARPRILSRGGPLIRVLPKDLAAAGVQRTPRVDTVTDGQPVLADGRVLEPANVVWCTGFHPGFSWIDLPIHGEHEPHHHAGVVADHPGLYFVGLHFLRALSSEMIHGVGRDADRIAGHIDARGPASDGTSATRVRATAPSVASWLPDAGASPRARVRP